jgi:hypothetical protein
MSLVRRKSVRAKTSDLKDAALHSLGAKRRSTLLPKTLATFGPTSFGADRLASTSPSPPALIEHHRATRLSI